jgi:hypothetical protein
MSDATTAIAEVPLEHIEHQLTELAAHINAASARFLALIAEFDRRRGWAEWECKSCAHWLSWKCGLGLVAGREHVRVARRLEELPLIREAFAAGELSYSKVRAMTRVAAPEMEDNLLNLARSSTTHQLERLVRAYRKVQVAEELRRSNVRRARRYANWRQDGDGSFVLNARLSPEDGAVVMAALEKAMAGAATYEQVESEVDAAYDDAVVPAPAPLEGSVEHLNIAAGLEIDEHTCASLWEGDRMPYANCVDGLAQDDPLFRMADSENEGPSEGFGDGDGRVDRVG